MLVHTSTSSRRLVGSLPSGSIHSSRCDPGGSPVLEADHHVDAPLVVDGQAVTPAVGIEHASASVLVAAEGHHPHDVPSERRVRQVHRFAAQSHTRWDAMTFHSPNAT